MFSNWRFLSLSIFLLGAGCTSSTQTPALIDGKTALAKKDYPAMLAVLDSGGAVAADGLELTAMRKRLAAVDAIFPEGEKQIADMTVSARDQLQEKGRTVTLAQILDDAAKIKTAVGGRKSPIKYAEWSAAYIVVQKSSQPGKS